MGSSCHTQQTCHVPRVPLIAFLSTVFRVADGLHAAHVEPRTERWAVTRQHDGAHPGLGLELLAGLCDAEKHRRVEGVALVGAGELDIGDAVVDRNVDAVGHHTILADGHFGKRGRATTAS
jgi:hypothetical protein